MPMLRGYLNGSLDLSKMLLTPNLLMTDSFNITQVSA